MKRVKLQKRLIALAVSFVLLIGCVGFTASAEDTNLAPIEQYKAYIDSLDWASYQTHNEMVEAAQIPNNLLNQMSTSDLVEAVMNYPLIVNLVMYSTYQKGFERIVQDFNGMQELLSKGDGAQKLFEYYNSIPIMSVNTRSSINEEIILNPWFAEIMLAQNEFIEQFSYTEQENVIAIINEKHEQKQSSPEIYSGTSVGFYEATMENNNISTYDYTTTVYTRKGSPVPVVVVSYHFTPLEVSNLNKKTDAAYPNAVRVGNACNQYNCHSYAWYSQSESNGYWLEPNNVYRFINDGSYYKTYARVGAVVKYLSDDHSAVVTAVSGNHASWVRSKWGKAGIYVHTPDYGYNAGQNDVGDKSWKLTYYI
ncbi:MAG: hypothetical protein ACOX6U_00735 [Oscillospiraceae bacterium]|jgi:hypothetical protein